MKPVRDTNSEPGLPVVRFIPLAQGDQQYEDKTGREMNAFFMNICAQILLWY